MTFTARSPEEQVPLAKVLVEHKSKTHGIGHSADWAHGYWQAIDDIAAAYGITTEPATRNDTA